MNRFYVIDKPTFVSGTVNLSGVQVPWHNLFSARSGSHYIDLGTVSGVDYILLSTDFDDSINEELWHQNPNVAHLFHPSLESFKQIGQLTTAQYAAKRFTADHMTALSNIGITSTHTVWDVHYLAQAIHPQVKLSNTY